MTGLACALALHAALRASHRPGVNLKQELRAIHSLRSGPLKLIAEASEPREIALTFDDGPHGTRTLELLGLLRQLHVKATFFVVGKMVDRMPWLVREELLLGNEVGNHTYDHPNLDQLTGAQVQLEYRACSDAIARATGHRPLFCRPPGGRFDAEVLRAAANEGMWTVLWTDDPGDFARPDPKVLVQRIDREMHNGGILLLHDGIEQTMRVLPGVVRELRARGYRFVTCSELLAQRQRRTAILARRTVEGRRPEAPLSRRLPPAGPGFRDRRVG